MPALRKLVLVQSASQPHRASRPIVVNARKVVTGMVLTCVGVELGLVLADATLNYAEWTTLGPIQRFFNITREDGVATWFAVTQTWMAALTLWLIVLALHHEYAPRWRQAGWALIAAFFSYMSMDDGSKLHERVGSAVAELGGRDAAGTALDALLMVFPSYTWQLLFVPAFGAMGLFIAAFLWREVSGRPRWLVFAALGLLAAAVGLDFIEGMDPEDPLNLHEHIRAAWALTAYDVSHFSKSLEEFMEMFANTLLWAVFCLQLASRAPELRFEFE